MSKLKQIANNDKFKQLSIWLAILSLVSMVFNNYGIFEIIGMSEDLFNEVTLGVLNVLVLVGILTNRQK